MLLLIWMHLTHLYQSWQEGIKHINQGRFVPAPGGQRGYFGHTGVGRDTSLLYHLLTCSAGY